MLNFFKSRKQGFVVKDIIWMTETAKWNGLTEAWKKDQSIVIITWFNATFDHLRSLFDQASAPGVSLLLAREVHSSHINGNPVIFAERYPLHNKEEELFQKLSLPEVIIYSAMNEPLFERFGGSKIVQMMKQLGMKENEPVQHKLISQSIHNAQEKIAKKLVVEHAASSQKEWMEKNIPPVGEG